MSPDILQHSITSRLCLLALSFPNLRILWSRCVRAAVVRTVYGCYLLLFIIYWCCSWH
jgi:hypothetical protein